ncbi:hypothetical protein Si087_01954 [Streptococcus infantarius subsp. infantarius]|nr:hypothetical protein [Streptococcus infantarius subsp. infantarius]
MVSKPGYQILVSVVNLFADPGQSKPETSPNSDTQVAIK